jgi:hypothetical protein
MPAPLSHLQKRDISIAARRAYDAWPEREAFEAINPEMSRTACFDAWRRVEQGKAVGIQSLREMTQAHFNRVLAHFEQLAGDAAGAERRRARDQDNDRRIALHKLKGACQAADVGLSYAATICRSQYRCGLDEASTKQLWNLFYTVRNRRAKTATPSGPPAPQPAESEDDPF